jgi:WD40 repeat protein
VLVCVCACVCVHVCVHVCQASSVHIPLACSVFDKETGKTVQTLPLAHHKGILSVSMSADGSTVASVGQDRKVCVCICEC